jgi:hypothetical protein
VNKQVPIETRTPTGLPPHHLDAVPARPGPDLLVSLGRSSCLCSRDATSYSTFRTSRPHRFHGGRPTDCPDETVSPPAWSCRDSRGLFIAVRANLVSRKAAIRAEGQDDEGDKNTGPIWLTRSVATDIQQFDMPS